MTSRDGKKERKSGEHLPSADALPPGPAGTHTDPQAAATPRLRRPRGRRARHVAVLEAATGQALTRSEVLALRKAIIASKGDSHLSGQVVDLLRESSILLALAHAAARSFLLDDLIPEVIGALSAAFEADRSVIMLHDPDRREFQVTVGGTGELRRLRLPDSVGLAGWVLHHGEALKLPDAPSDPRFWRDIDLDPLAPTYEVIAAPLRTPLGTIIGVGELLNGKKRRRFTDRDLELFTAAMNQVVVPLQNAWLLDEIVLRRAEQKRAEGELAAGRAIQRGLLPRLPKRPDLDVAALVEPAKPLGGDLYDLVLLNEHTLFFLIGDVAGKGIPAALFMAVTHSLFRSHVRQPGQRLADLVTRVNAELWEDNPEGLFVTAFCGMLDLVTGEMDYVVCGHDIPFLVHLDGGPVERLPGRINPAICFDPDVTYRSDHCRLLPGDLLLMYTDGVSEALNPNRQLFGHERISDVLREHPSDRSARTLITTVRTAVEAFRDGAPRSDDTSLLALRWLGPMLKPAE
jgi:serine phosphatase RsbU (regulator of sigma subunit)